MDVPAESPTPLQSEENEHETVTDNDDPEDQILEPQDAPNDEDDEAVTSPPVEADTPDSRAESPPQLLQPTTRGRGRGRGRRGRPPTRKVENGTPEVGDEGTDTPRKRGRGGWRGGFRGRPRRGGLGSAFIQKPPVDKDGNILEVIDDEIVFTEDPDGEDKVNESGELLDGREYRVRTFTVVGRKGRLYMLSTEPARCTGYRDSYLFFNKHPRLYKIILNDAEKRDLIEREVLPNSYKGRAIGVVTARSVYRDFGSRIVVGGKKIIDDYRVQEARERGDVEGELADPEDKLPPEGQPYNRNQYVAWHGASQVYHQNPAAGPGVPGAPVAGRKRPRVTGANWMFEHARAASLYNSELAAQRRLNNLGVYDPHTNQTCYPQIMQPTHAIWEKVEEADDEAERDSKRRRVNGDAHDEPAFEKPSALVSRNYLVVDTQFITPPHASLSHPNRVTGQIEDVMGTSSDHRRLPDLPADSLSTLTPEAQLSYRKARALTEAWTGMWHQPQDASHSRLRIGVGPL